MKLWGVRVKRGTREWKMVYKGNRAKFLQNEGARMELFESMAKNIGRGE